MTTNKKFLNKFWRILKLVLVSFIGVIVILSIAATIVFEQKKEWISAQLQGYVNRAQSGYLEIDGLELKLVKHFPSISIALNGVNYYEHRDSVSKNKSPILQAEKLFIALEFWALMHYDLRVSKITLSESKLNIIEYDGGVLNLENALAKPKQGNASPAEPVTIDVKAIHLNDILLTWNSSTGAKPSVFFTNELDANLSYSKQNLDCKLTSTQLVQEHYLNKLQSPVKGDVALEIDFSFNFESQNLTIRSSKLNYNAFTAEVQGTYAHLNNRAIDIQFDASSNDIEMLSLLIKQDAIKLNPDFIQQGDIFLKGQIFGELKKQAPQINVSFGAKDLKLHFGHGLEEFNDIGFDGTFKTGSATDYSEAVLEIKNLKGKLPGGTIRGQFYLNNLVQPYLRYYLNATTQLDGFDRIFQIGFLENLKGKISAKAEFDGMFNRKDKHKMDSGRASTIVLNDLSFNLPSNNRRVSNVSGTLSNKNNQVSLTDLKFVYGDSDFLVNGEISNLSHFLFGQDSSIEFSGGVQSKNIVARDLTTDTLNTAAKNRIRDFSLDCRGRVTTDKLKNGREFPYIEMVINSMSFSLPTYGKQVSSISGRLENKNNQVAVTDLKILCNKSDLLLNGSINNLLPFLIKKEGKIEAAISVQSSEIFTEDFIVDTARTAIVQDRIHDLRFNLGTTLANNEIDSASMPRIAFEINGLTAKLDKLADFKNLSAKGELKGTANGLKLDVGKFHADFPNGKFELTGDLIFLGKGMLEFNAQVDITKFPWAYASDLIHEIDSHQVPIASNLPTTQKEIITAKVNLSALVKASPFGVNKLVVRDSYINYKLADSISFEVGKLNLTLNDLLFNFRKDSSGITGLRAANCQMNLEKLVLPKFNPVDMTMNIAGKNDKLDFKFSTNRQNLKSESGNLLLDFSQKDLEYRLIYKAQKIPLEPLFKDYKKGALVKGNVDLNFDIKTKGTTWPIIRHNLKGNVTVSGGSLSFNGIDIDDLLKKYERSQKFNLVDVGAFFVMGPAGPAVTKGKDFAVLITAGLDTTRHTSISAIHAQWKVADGLLTTTDVAMATQLNRIAFQGTIDFEKETVPGFTAAVIDKYGCSLMDQKIHGKIGALQRDKVNVAKTLLGSVINFVNVVVGNDCTPFYTGSVRHPVNLETGN